MRQTALCLLTKGDLTLGIWNPRAQGWGLPGGKIEPSETARQAAVRELREETGVAAREADGKWVYSAASSFDPNYHVHVFRVLRWHGEAQTLEESHPVRWLPWGMFEVSESFGPFYKEFRRVMFYAKETAR